MVKQVCGGHAADDAGVGHDFFGLGDDPVALVGAGAEWHQVVVVEVEPPRADVRQLADVVDRPQRRSRRVAEWIAAAVGGRPQAEGELVLGFRFVVAHRFFLLFL